MMHNSSLVFLILASLLVTKVMSQRGNKEIVYKLDKAAKSIGNIKDFCHGQKAWLEGEELVNVSCHSMYQLCQRTVDSLYPERIILAYDDGNSSNSTTVSDMEAYGYGFVMVLVVSLLSLLGILLVPLLSNGNRFGRVAYKYVLTLLTAMGVSALLCDVFFELLPTVFHIDGSHDNHNIHNDDDDSYDHLWKASGVVGGIFLFYVLELVLHSFIDTAKTSQGDVFPKKKSTQLEEQAPLVFEKDIVVKTPPSSVEHEHKTNCQKIFRFRDVRPLGWIILLGDLTHNLADGMTLGVTVSQSLALGLSTTFAICLHEIPHELADFGILVKSGFHWIAALLFNFLSSLTALAGFFIGVAISANSTVLKEWLLAVAAGSFLYISLADLLPELRFSSHSHDHSTSSPPPEQHHTWHHKILHGTLVLLGFAIAFVVLLIVSLNEDKINQLF